MNIVINKNLFTEAVHTVARYSERRSGTLPVLSAVLLVSGKDGIRFRATNLETGIDLLVEGEVKEEGVVALPAQILKDVASSLSGSDTVTLSTEKDVVVLKSGKARSTLKTLSVDDFPTIPLPEGSKTQITLPGVTLKGLFNSVAACASPSTVRPELASVLLSSEGGVLKAVATDSFRLAEKKVTLQGTSAPFTLLVPAKNVLDIMQTIPDDEVTLEGDEHQCAFSWKGGVAISRLVGVNYPDYAQIIPKSFVAGAEVMKKDLEASLRRVAVFSDSFQKVRLGFDGKQKAITLFSQNNDVGESQEVVQGTVKGETIELSFNHRYLSTPFPLISSESVSLSSGGIGRPLVIRGVGDTSFLYLVMPMNQ